MGKILNGFGVSAYTIDRLDRRRESSLPAAQSVRAGHKYTAFIHERDSLTPAPRLFGLRTLGDGLCDSSGSRQRFPVSVCCATARTTRCAARRKSAVINSAGAPS